jgi:hypothetical protein
VNPADDNRRELARLADELLEQAAALRRQYEDLSDMLDPDEPEEPEAVDDVLERRAG